MQISTKGSYPQSLIPFPWRQCTVGYSWPVRHIITSLGQSYSIQRQILLLLVLETTTRTTTTTATTTTTTTVVLWPILSSSCHFWSLVSTCGTSFHRTVDDLGTITVRLQTASYLYLRPSYLTLHWRGPGNNAYYLDHNAMRQCSHYHQCGKVRIFLQPQKSGC